MNEKFTDEKDFELPQESITEVELSYFNSQKIQQLKQEWIKTSSFTHHIEFLENNKDNVYLIMGLIDFDSAPLYHDNTNFTYQEKLDSCREVCIRHYKGITCVAKYYIKNEIIK